MFSYVLGENLWLLLIILFQQIELRTLRIKKVKCSSEALSGTVSNRDCSSLSNHSAKYSLKRLRSKFPNDFSLNKLTLCDAMTNSNFCILRLCRHFINES